MQRRDKDCSAFNKSDPGIVPFSINFAKLIGAISLANKEITYFSISDKRSHCCCKTSFKSSGNNIVSFGNNSFTPPPNS